MANATIPPLDIKLLQEPELAADSKHMLNTRLDLSTHAVDTHHPHQAVPPPHRSHDPATNQKRADPFQFGSRYLQESDNVFEFNAWDHVETDDTYKEYAEVQYAKQRESPVSEFDKSEYTVFLTSSHPSPAS